jgi:Bacterial Ig-like domain (group 3)
MRDHQALPRWVWCCLLMAALISALLVPGGARAATALGGLTLSPASGLASSPISMTTVSSGAAKGCPAPSTNILGYITGPGAWAEGILGVSNTDTGVSLTSDFGVELSDTFSGIAQSNGVTIQPGKYTITVYCANDLGSVRFGEFAASVWFTDATRYQTTDPANPAPGPTTPPAPTPGPTVTTPPVPGGNAVVTTTALSVSPAGSSVSGAPVTLTATVSPSTAVGSVTFRDGSGAAAAVLGTSQLASGAATFSTADLAAGGHELSASFVPTAPTAFAASQSTGVAHAVTSAPAPGALGTLAVLPPTGIAGDPIYFRTESLPSRPTKGCPSPATNVSGTVTGPGAWASGVLLVQNTDTDVSVTEEFAIAASDTMLGIAASNGLQIEVGRYDLTVKCQDDLGVNVYGQFTASIWFTDVTRYQSTDPDSSQTPTQVVVTANPADRIDLGQRVTLTAAVNPATAVGAIQFQDNRNGTFGPVGDPVAVSGGSASISSTTLAFGLYRFSAVFTPADNKKFTPSTSKDLVFVVALPVPPVPKGRAVLTGKVKVGQKIGCSAAFKNAKSLRYAWIRDRDTVVGGAGASYRLTSADAGHAIRCRALAANDGGTTSRTSRASRVAR